MENKSIKCMIMREGLRLLIFVAIVLGLILFWNGYESNLEEFRKKHDITLIDREGKKWGIFSTNFYSDDSDNAEKFTDIFDVDGERRVMGRDGELRESDTDMLNWSIVDDNLTEAELKISNEKFRNSIIERRNLINQALRAHERSMPILWITRLAATIIVFGYSLYLLVRFLVFFKQLVKIHGLRKIFNEVRRWFKVTFSNEVLIKVILILGIIYLCVLLFKSCDFLGGKNNF